MLSYPPAYTIVVRLNIKSIRWSGLIINFRIYIRLTALLVRIINHLSSPQIGKEIVSFLMDNAVLVAAK